MDTDNVSIEQSLGQFKALAHPTRLRLLDMLLAGKMHVLELAAPTQLAQPTITYHLQVLRKAGLIEREKNGVYVYYMLNPAGFSGVASILRAFASSKRGVSRR